MKKLKLITLFFLVCAASRAQETTDKGGIVTDRPDATESPTVIPKGYLQVETGAYFESFEENTITRERWVYNTTLLRYGLLDNLELRVGWDLEGNLSRVNGTRLGDLESTFSPLLFGMKVAIVEEKGGMPEIGLIGHLMLPFSVKKEIRPENTGVDFKFSFGHTLSEKSSLAYNIGAQWENDSSEVAYIYTIAYGYAFTDKFGGYMELYGDLPEDSSANHLWDAGLTYLLKPSIQFDVTVGTSITKGQDILLSAGLSFRIPN